MHSHERSRRDLIMISASANGTSRRLFGRTPWLGPLRTMFILLPSADHRYFDQRENPLMPCYDENGAPVNRKAKVNEKALQL